VRWLIIDRLYNAAAFTFGHLDSYGFYLKAMDQMVDRIDVSGQMAFPRFCEEYDVVFALEGYDLALSIPAKKRIAQVACGIEVPRGFSAIISSIPAMVDHYKARGDVSFYQPLAFDLRARACMMGVERDLDCIFIGSTGANHVRRTRLLEELKDIVTVLPPVFGREYFRTLARAKVVLNVHSEWAQGAANAMRLYEGAGMGCAVVSDGIGGPSTYIPFDGTAANARERIESCLHGPQPADWGDKWALSTETYECDDRVPQLIRWAKEI